MTAKTAEPPTGETPRRTVRVADPTWAAAMRRARREGTTVTAAITAFLRAYGEGDGSQNRV